MSFESSDFDLDLTDLPEEAVSALGFIQNNFDKINSTQKNVLLKTLFTGLDFNIPKIDLEAEMLNYSVIISLNDEEYQFLKDNASFASTYKEAVFQSVNNAME